MRAFHLRKISLLFVFFTISVFPIVSHEAIIPFSESWAINISAKYVITSFFPEQPIQYTTDRPWVMGLGIRYKNMTATLFLPSFYSFNERPFESFDIQTASYYDFVYYEAFFRRYHGFSDGETENRNIDLSIFSSGIFAGWLPNGKNHSLSAAYNLDCRQTASSGSLILGFGVYYISIVSGETSLLYYNDKQHLVYFGPNIGYSYTFVFSKNLFLNMNIVIGLSAGININADKWLPIPLLMPKISFGHHHSTWSLNVAAGCDYTVILWGKNAIDSILPATMKLTFSKRF